jgi:hypothetical protein
MLTSLDEINHYRGVVVKYLAGSSGEFFSYLISQTFSNVAKFQNKFSQDNNNYVSDTRFKFNDFFGYSLLTGDACTNNHQLLLDRINWYLSYADLLSGTHIGLAHPHSEYLNFLSTYCKNWKTITITVEQPASKKFFKSARIQKLKTLQPDACYKNLCLPTGLQNINLEWQDLILGPAAPVIQTLENFLNLPGNPVIFETIRSEYVERNRHLIDAKSN